MSTTLKDLLPIVAAIANDRDRRHSLAELATLAKSSPSTFQRAFSRIVGESAKQFSRRLQLECAALSLISTTQSVLDVGLACGFESHEGFTRAFGRHFGQPPKTFRKRYSDLGNETHIALIRHVGPCVGLFHSSLEPTATEDTAMNYDITRQPIEETVFLYKKARCSHADVADTLAKLLPAVFQHAMSNGIEFRGPPTSLYTEWGPGMVTIQAGMAVASAEPTEDIFVETLPAGEAAVTIHTGSYDGLGDAHAAVDQYLAEQSLKKAGAAREIYLTDPGEVPDPKDWKTQIVWPVSQ